MQYLANLAQKPAKFLRDKCNPSLLILSGLIFLILCAFTSFARSAAVEATMHEIRRRTRKNYSAEEKVRIVLAVTMVARRHHTVVFELLLDRKSFL
jgi:hypothetical protein